MSSQKRPKGILKPPSSFSLHADAPLQSEQLPPFVPPPPPRIQSSASTSVPTGFDTPQTITLEQHARNRELAIRHATILQHRKDAEALVLTNLEELMDFPSAHPPAATSARPAHVDIERFQTLITPFNISDYDELLTERNCADHCAYLFCPTVLKRDRSARANVNRLRYDGSKFHTVKQAVLDRWCSSVCARRALYIRVQLSETPAWERAGGSARPIELLRDGDDALLEEKMRNLQVGSSSADQDAMAIEDEHNGNNDDDEALMQAAMEQLALERGDATADSSRRGAVMRGSIVEKPISSRSTVVPPTKDGRERGNGAIEGYEPRMMNGDGDVDDQDDADDDSNDDDDHDDLHQHSDSDWVL